MGYSGVAKEVAAMEYLAKPSRVSARTLRYYDEIGPKCADLLYETMKIYLILIPD